MNKLTLYKPIYPFNIVQHFGENLVPLYKQLGMLGHNGLDCIRGCDKGWTDKVGYFHQKCYECEGCNVRAAHDGIITYAGVDSKGGVGVVVKTLNQFDYNNAPTYFKTIYWHLQPLVAVKVGQQVKIGDVLGHADTTGNATACHLHFGLKPILQGENEWTWYNLEQNNGYLGAIDPIPYLIDVSAYEYKFGLVGPILNKLIGLH